MKNKRVLFVEGADDQHTIWALCEHFKIKQTFDVEIPDSTGKINGKALPSHKGGIDNVIKATELNLIAGSDAVERIGIVIDADQDLDARWQKVKNILIAAGYGNLPDDPDEDGTIVKQEFKPDFGVWIMPDNKIRGMLEDFLSFLVPENDLVWEKAVECSRAVLEMEAETFSAIHLSKAQIHAYLAWQQDPGKPFGQAITAKYLNAADPSSEKFVGWLNRLFVD